MRLDFRTLVDLGGWTLTLALTTFLAGRIARLEWHWWSLPACTLVGFAGAVWVIVVDTKAGRR